MTSAQTVSAAFTRILYRLSVTAGAGGSVGGTLPCAAASICTADLSSGTPVTLSASPAPGYRFTGWSGACTATSGDCAITMDRTQGVIAFFARFSAARCCSITASCWLT